MLQRHDAAPFRGVKEQSLHEAVEEDESSRHWVEPSRLSKGFSQAVRIDDTSVVVYLLYLL